MVFDPTPFVGKFTQEARELIQKLNEYLMLLEKTPDNQDALRELMLAQRDRVEAEIADNADVVRETKVFDLA